MKQKSIILFTLVLLLTLMNSCYKAHNLQPPNVPPTFTIESTTNGGDYISFDSSSQGYLFNFMISSGNAENYPIFFYVDSVPPGVKVTPDSGTFKLNYSLYLTIGYNGRYNGQIRFLLNVVSITQGLQKIPVIVDATPCYTNIIGVYNGCYSFKNNSLYSPTYTSVIDTIPGMPNWITISNFNNLSITITAEYFCYNGAISIPLQNDGGYTVKGNGTLTSLIDTVTYPGDTAIYQTEL